MNHSQKMNEPPLHVWVMCNQDGSVETAHCTCMAGASEVCSHVGAVLYALEYIHTSRSTTSSTDVECLWNVPRKVKINYQPIKEMDFGRVIGNRMPLDLEVPPIEGQEMVSFLRDIEEAGTSSVLMRIVEPFASDVEALQDTLPNIYRTLFKEEYLGVSKEHLQDVIGSMTIELSEADCNSIAERTKEQANSREWFKHRSGRITASKFKLVCKTSVDKPSLSLVKSICYPTKFLFKTKATMWGINHEKDAVAAYLAAENPYHQDLTIEEVGLQVIPQYPQFGASPDRLRHCTCCGSGCVEVKCPFLLKTMSFDQFVDLKTSCVVKTSDGIFLDKKHSYYYQIQMQMAITKTSFCDFVVWGPNCLCCERVHFNEDFWASESAKALEFHKGAIMPELVGRYFTRSNQEIIETWCVCNGVDDGRPMIACDSDKCIVKWYHLDCVSLQDIPFHPWYCNTCLTTQ